MFKPIHIVGGGMAGSEAAWQIISAGIPVVLHEMRPKVETFAPSEKFGLIINKLRIFFFSKHYHSIAGFMIAG